MDYKEYEQKRTSFLKALTEEFIMSNNTVKVGDIVTDHIGSIEVERIAPYEVRFGKPVCQYYGKNLLKSGKQSKRDPYRTVYQCNLINHPSAP